MRIIGLDVGDVRIGVAASDPTEFLASGIMVYRRTGDLKKDAQAIAREIESLNGEAIVIGDPINMNGTRGPACEKIREFASALQCYCELPIEFLDERLTTMEATRILIDADLSRKKRKGVVDKLAAQIILQCYLDRRIR